MRLKSWHSIVNVALESVWLNVFRVVVCNHKRQELYLLIVLILYVILGDNGGPLKSTMKVDQKIIITCPCSDGEPCLTQLA